MHFKTYNQLDIIMGTNTNTITQRKQKATVAHAAPPQISARNVPKGVWQLARLHTKEAWLCWYPAGWLAICLTLTSANPLIVWGLCLSAGTQDIRLNILEISKILFGIWSSVTVTHCAFCTWE